MPGVKFVTQFGQTGRESLVPLATQAPDCSSQQEMTRTFSTEHPCRSFRESISTCAADREKREIYR